MTEPDTLPSALRRAGRWAASLPAHGLLAALWLYRRTLSPLLPAVFGPTCGCRFHPTCAVYAAEAVRAHGAARGALLAVRRLLKCHPFHSGGFDPVPPAPWRRTAVLPPRPVVRRVTRGPSRPATLLVSPSHGGGQR
jgi:uncharacterized protein